MSGTKCRISGCLVEKPPRLILCLPHWRIVPKRLQDDIWQHYRDGQESGAVRPRQLWLAAARKAIEHVENLYKALSEREEVRRMR